MSGLLFEPNYASAYDAIYADKDYNQECDLIETALRRYGIGEAKAILDLGCGTGGHALPLARRGYRLTGLDQSPAMIEIARKKALDENLDIQWSVGDVRSTKFGQVFDAALLMFAVLGYQTTNQDVLATLRNVRRHLRDGGVLVFDVWYGVPVLGERPGDRLKVVQRGGNEIVRAVSSVLDVQRNIVDVRIRTWEFENSVLRGKSDETHAMRFFFPVELAQLLNDAGFGIARFCAFPDLEAAPDAHNWNLGCVAIAGGAAG